ncbi:hypothetical protein D3C78_1411280 [compost metagenome]
MNNNIICKICGDLRPGTNNGICESCMIDYKTIHAYVLANPQSIIMEISNETGIAINKIMTFVQGGHFILVEGTFKLNE